LRFVGSLYAARPSVEGNILNNAILNGSPNRRALCPDSGPLL
jgi:hypothetical protein